MAHEEHVARLRLGLAGQAHERTVRAPEVGQKQALPVPGQAAVQAGDVAVLGGQHVAALAPEVDAALGDGEGVPGLVATDDQRDATDVALAGGAEALDPVGRGGLAVERLEADDLLADAEDLVRLELHRDVAPELLVHPVERALVLPRDLSGPGGPEGGVAGREIAVAGEDAARLAADGAGAPGELEGPRLA